MPKQIWIPEPIVYRGPRSLWRHRLMCPVCDLLLKDRDRYHFHYKLAISDRHHAAATGPMKYPKTTELTETDTL